MPECLEKNSGGEVCMKKAALILEYILVTFLVLSPLGTFVLDFWDYYCEWENDIVMVSIPTLITVIIVILSIIIKQDLSNKIFAILSILSVLFFIFYIVFYSFISSSVLGAIILFIGFGCSFYLAVRYGKPLALKIVGLILCGILVVPSCFIIFLALLFGHMGSNTVVQTVYSPQKNYYAQVIASNQGALGGDTLVDVYQNSGVNINLLFLKISKKPQRVYIGEWGEFENMEIHWQSESCLVIDDEEYFIH